MVGNYLVNPDHIISTFSEWNDDGEVIVFTIYLSDDNPISVDCSENNKKDAAIAHRTICNYFNIVDEAMESEI